MQIVFVSNYSFKFLPQLNRKKNLTNQVPGREEKFDFGLCGLGGV